MPERLALNCPYIANAWKGSFKLTGKEGALGLRSSEV
jgi:hypothetical protein